MRTPKPQTTRAILISRGYDRPVATVHLYHSTHPVEIPGVFEGAPIGYAWEHLFQCFKTGALRRWGTEHREPGMVIDEPSDPDPEGAVN